MSFRLPRRFPLLALLSTSMAFIGLALIGWTKYSPRPRSIYGIPWYRTVDVNAIFPDFSIQPVNAAHKETTDSLLRGRWTFLICTSGLDGQKQTLEYTPHLLDQFRAAGVQVSYIFNDTRTASYASQIAQTGIVEPRLSLYSNDNLRSMFHLPASGSFAWSFLIDPQKVVRFSLPDRLDADTMRQLAQRYITGAVDYRDAVTPEGYRIGRSIPEATLTSLDGVRHFKLSTIARGPSTIIFFKTDCTRCAVSNYIAQLDNLYRHGHDFSAEKIIPVFSKSFAGFNLQRSGLSPPAAGEVFLAEGYLPGWEDPNFTGLSETNVPTVIMVSDTGRIVDVERYTDWYRAVTNATLKPAKFRPHEATNASLSEHVQSSPSVYQSTQILPASVQKNICVECPSEIRLQWLAAVRSSSTGELYVLDSLNNRVLVVDSSGNILRHIGVVGQEPGNLYQPADIAFGSGGDLYVLDSGNSRVQILSHKGHAISQFRIGTTSDSLGVLSNGDILLNTPRDGSIITVFSPEGKVRRQFGHLPEISDGYPEHFNRPEWNIALGRAHLVVTNDDSVYILYDFLPLIQKYEMSGRLMWTLRLSGEPIDELSKSFWKTPGSGPAQIVKNLDGIQLADIQTFGVLADNGTLVTMLADRSLCFVSPQGRQLGLVRSNSLEGGAFVGGAILRGTFYANTTRALYRTDTTF